MDGPALARTRLFIHACDHKVRGHPHPRTTSFGIVPETQRTQSIPWQSKFRLLKPRKDSEVRATYVFRRRCRVGVSGASTRTMASELRIVTDGLEKTFGFLEQSRNQSTEALLLQGFQSPQPAIRHRALKSILKVGGRQAVSAVVEHWFDLDATERQLVLEQPRRLPNALRLALKSDQRVQLDAALEITAATTEPSLAPELVRLVEEETSAVRPQASQTLLSIVRTLCESPRLDSSASASSFAARRHQKATRDRVLECLEKSVERFVQHRSEAIAEAYLLLADPRSQLLRRCLRNPREPAMPVLTRILGETNDTQLVCGTLVELIQVPEASPAMLRIWSTRTDDAFLHAFCSRIGRTPNEHVRSNLKRMKSIRWLTGNLAHLERLEPNEQVAVLHIVKLAKLDANDVFRIVEYLLLRGNSEVQLRAAEYLEDIRTPTADRLIARLVTHEDPSVKAIAISQLRDRRIPGASERLLEALDSEHAVVRNAARRAFPDIDMERYLASFDAQSPEAQRATGQLVLKVDDEAVTTLQAELRHGARNRRLRGLQVIDLLSVTEPCQEAIAECLHDDEYFVRLSAARLLGACRSSFARSALRDSLMDASASVREAAERALQGMAQIPAEPYLDTIPKTN